MGEGTNDQCKLYRVRPSINRRRDGKLKKAPKNKFWQTVFVSDILQACMQMSAIFFVACEKAEKGHSFLHAAKEIGDV